MSLLSGLGIIMWPVAKFLGGQLYDIGGYYAVYITAMCCTFLGVGYIYFVPETIMKREKANGVDKKHLVEEDDTPRTFHEQLCYMYKKAKHIFYVGNRTILEAYR